MRIIPILLFFLLANVAFAQEDTISNVLTPNFDGKNDYMMLQSSGVSSATIKIFNRYGEIVYQNVIVTRSGDEDMLYLWDGRTNAGMECSEGTYFYVLKYEGVESGAQEAKGTVTLFR